MCGQEKSLSAFSKRTQKGRTYPVAYCKPCWALKYRRERAADIEKHRKYKRQWALENKDKVSAHNAASRKKNRDALLVLSKEWRANNKDKISAYREANRYRFAQWSMARYAKQKNAVPAWADFSKIEQTYKMASDKGLTVDHIVPLTSRLVCGLHVHDNLQILSQSDNSRKRNYYWPDMPWTL